MGAQSITHPIMRAFIIGSVLLLAAIACAEMTPEDTMVSDDFQVPNELVESPASALAETETDIASSSKTASAAKTSAGFWRRRRRYVHPCQGIWNERAHRERGNKERSHKHNERVNKERGNKERAHKERANKHNERVAKERGNKERTAKERSNK